MAKKIHELYDPPKSRTSFSEGHKSKGILADHAVRQHVASKEGTIEHTPTNYNHIVNKKFLDDNYYSIVQDKYVLNTGDTMTGTLFLDTIGTGLDVMYSATIGNHLEVGDNLTVDTNTLFVNATNHRVGIGTTSPDKKLEVVGDTKITGDVVIGEGATEMPLTIYQKEDFKGIKIYGFDDRSSEAIDMHISSFGAFVFDASTEVNMEVGSVQVWKTQADGFRLQDNKRFKFGNGDDYHFRYDTSSTSFKLYTTNADGIGTNGRIFEVQDGTDDVDFIGEISSADKSKLTNIGGFAIKLTNKTGANSVAGQLVQADTTTNDAVKLTEVDEEETMGVFLDGGVSDGSEAWIVVNGIADVAMEDNTTATRGNWVRTSATIGEEGYADATNAAPPSPAAFSHFNEIGNCIETVTAGGEGTHILARCVLHFN